MDDLNRCSRSAKTIEHIIRERKVVLISVSDAETADSLVPPSGAARVEAEDNAISSGAKEALKTKAARVPPGNRTNLPVAQKLGAQANKPRSDDKAMEIANAIQRHGWEHFSTPRLVKALNRIGITTSRKLPWTVPALRRPLRKARQIADQRQKAEYERNENFGLF